MDAENFLRRWARRKHEAAKTPAAAAEAPLDELPPVEALDFESDFGAFLRAKVDERVRRAALKKLFSDPRFNVTDGLDIYIDDYSKEDPIPPGLLAQLEHARGTLFGRQPEERGLAQTGTQPPKLLSNAPPEKDCETNHASNSEG
jgi:hypothetical protein